MTKLNFRDDWRALGLVLTPPRKTVECPTSDAVQVTDWLGGIGTDSRDWLCVTGPNPQARAALYRELADGPWELDYQHARDWLTRQPIESFTDFASRLQAGINYVGVPQASRPWGWLWAMAEADDLYIDEPLRSMADRGTSILHEAVLLFFEVRWRLREGGAGAIEAFQAFIDWLTGQPLTDEQYRIVADVQGRRAGTVRQVNLVVERTNLLLFFLTWAEQNNVICKVMATFDDLESAARNGDRQRLRLLHDILLVVSRWSSVMEIPLAVLVGTDSTKLPLLRRMNPKLAHDVQTRMAPGPV